MSSGNGESGLTLEWDQGSGTEELHHVEQVSASVDTRVEQTPWNSAKNCMDNKYSHDAAFLQSIVK